MSDVKTLLDKAKAYRKQEYRAAHPGLNSGATAAEIDALQKSFGVHLPKEYIELLKLANGADGTQPAYIFEIGQYHHSDWQFNSTAGVKAHADHLKSMAGENSKPSGKAAAEIQSVQWDSKWVPVFSDTVGNTLCLDFHPTSKGKTGQMIYVDHDRGEHHVVTPDFITGLDKIVTHMAGNIDPAKATEEEPKKKGFLSKLFSKESISQESIAALYKPQVTPSYLQWSSALESDQAASKINEAALPIKKLL